MVLYKSKLFCLVLFFFKRFFLFGTKKLASNTHCSNKTKNQTQTRTNQTQRKRLHNAMNDSLSLHTASTISRKTETKEQRKARVIARKKLRDAEKEQMKILEEAARKKKLLDDQKHEYEDRELTTKETLKIADLGTAAIKSGVMHSVNVWYAMTQVRHGGFIRNNKRHRTYDCQNYKQRNIISEAAEAGHMPALRMMLEVGGATGQYDATGLTAIHLAMVNGHLDCACLLLMHDNWKEWKYERNKKKLKQQKKNGLLVEGKEQIRQNAEEESYSRATDMKVKSPQCKAILENLLRCPDDVAENGFCARQSCKMQGFEMVKSKMAASRLIGEEFDAYAWNKNPYEKMLENKSVAVARAMKLHHAVMIIEGLNRFSRRAFHGALDIVEGFTTENKKTVEKAMKKLQGVFSKRKQVGVQPTKKGVRNPYHDDLISLHGLLAAYLGSPQTPHMYGTVSVGAHVAQSLGLLIQKVRREFPKCWSVNCEREYELLISVATDEHGFNNQDEFKTSTGLWRHETTESDWIMDSKRIEKESVKPKMGRGWDVEGFVG